VPSAIPQNSIGLQRDPVEDCSADYATAGAEYQGCGGKAGPALSSYCTPPESVPRFRDKDMHKHKI
jgi:hypothetical protein